MGLVLSFLFGLFGGEPAELIDKHYERITRVDDLPEIGRRIVYPDGHISLPYGEARYGWRIDVGNARGAEVYTRVRQILGEPLPIPWGDEMRWGYMWRHRGNPGRGMMLIVHRRARSVHLKSWFERDKARTSRIGMAAENEIYRWFEWLTTPPSDDE